METQDLIAAGTSIGALGAVYWTVYLFRRQLKIMSEQNVQLTKALELSAESALDVLFVTIAQAYLDHPELRSIFNEGEGGMEPAAPDRDTALRAAAVAETLADAMERSLMRQEAWTASVGVTLRVWVNDSFRNSRFFREWLSLHRDWYTEPFLAILDDVERQLAMEASASTVDAS